MRLSEQMAYVLKVLATSENPLKMTEIIMKVKGLKPVRKKFETHDGKIIEIPPFIQLELVSALAGESVSWWMGRNIYTGRDLEPFHAEARKLYVSFGRTIKKLVQNGLVDAKVDWIRTRWGFNDYRKRQYAYYITDKGREVLDRSRNP